MRLVVVTGVSGAGKSTALRALEDLGFYAVDNLPLPLVSQFIELFRARTDIDRAALGLDARGGAFLAGAPALFADLRKAGHTVEVLYLDASDEILIRRFSETRRRHPLSDTDIRAGIAAERQALAELRQAADGLVDTGTLTVHVLRALIQERYGRGEGELSVTFLSFGFKHGIPAESDIVLDVRFLPNPFFVPQLSALSGEDELVARFVLDAPDTKGYLAEVEQFLRLSIHGFLREGKSYATVAIGCTGGRHRSVTIAKELARRISGPFSISVRHRDIQHGGVSLIGLNWGSMASSEQEPSPMVGLVIVTHGGSGECLLAAAEGLVGPIAASAAVSITLDDSFEQQVSRIEAACGRVDSGDGIVILADVHGSSPFRASLAMLDGTRAVEIVCGINLPMLIKLATVDRHALRPVEIAEIAKEVGKRSIRLGSELTGKLTISREERH